MPPPRSGSRPPTFQEALDALREWHALTAEEEERLARERRYAQQLAEGWSPAAIQADLPRLFHEAPPGLPDHLSDRKSKGKRAGAKKPKWTPWYFR